MKILKGACKKYFSLFVILAYTVAKILQATYAKIKHLKKLQQPIIQQLQLNLNKAIKKSTYAQ